MSATSSPCPDMSEEIYNVLKDIPLSPLTGQTDDAINIRRVLHFDEEFILLPLPDLDATEFHINNITSPFKDNSEVVSQEEINATTQEQNDLDDPDFVPRDSENVTADEPNASNIKLNTRKRVCNKNAWKSNIRKQKRESGEEYTNIKGKTKRKREVQGTCKPNCSFKCTQLFSAEERQQIHKQFWKLSDSKKSHYFNKYVIKKDPVRKRTKAENSRISHVYLYHFNADSERTRVCKEFFLNTLDISQQRIYYFFKKIQNNITNVPRSPLKGKNVKKHTPIEKIEEIKNHINSFPVVESHYCRANTQKKYLESTLNITRMYDLYKIQVENPVEYNIYNRIFNTQFNLQFHKPKKDLCDKCTEFKVIRTPSSKQIADNEEHLKKKEEGRIERKLDRERCTNLENNEQVAVVTFDLENVFTLPKSEVSNFYYKCKLNTYNLTAHCNINKTVYNCLWHECVGGRSGNDLASALVKILNRVVADIPSITRIILWSDSCVPQNKNSIMSTALLHFLASENSNNLRVIEQKFSEPGHGNLQEVDAAHSVIERFIRNIEIYSPLGLTRCLLKIPKKQFIFKVINMNKTDFLNYQAVASTFTFSTVPYTKIKQILYDKSSPNYVKYRNLFSDEFTMVKIIRSKSPRVPKLKNSKHDNSAQTITAFPKINTINSEPVLGEKKVKHLKEMLKYMIDNSDKEFYKAILQSVNVTKDK